MRRPIRLLLIPLAALTLGAALPPTYDLTGSWSYEIFEIAEVGPCPTTGDSSGEAEIAQTGGIFTLDYLSGQACLPEGVCHFTGTVDGDRYHAENEVEVPGGGVTTNSLDFEATSSTAASGVAVTTFRFGGDSCVWTYDFAITAPEPAAAALSALLSLAVLSARSTRRAARGSVGPWSAGSARR